MSVITRVRTSCKCLGVFSVTSFSCRVLVSALAGNDIKQNAGKLGAIARLR